MKKIIENRVLKIPGIDLKNTKVLLVGVSKYPEDESIASIPNVKQNIKELKKIFSEKNLVGVPDENIIVSLNENKLEIERKISSVVSSCLNNEYTLIIYYAGHGIISAEDFKLYLTTLNSTKEFLESDSISISRFQEIISKSRAGRKMVIIDACHSGQIHNHMDNLSSKLNIELSKFEGTYVMTSASEDNPSLFPAEDTKQPTYFTGCLIETIKEGINNNKPYCSVKEIYNVVDEKLQNLGNMPKPQQSSFKNADEMILCLNNKFKPITEDEFYWGNALFVNTLEMYVDFIKKFPESKNINNALNKIELLKSNSNFRINADLHEIYNNQLKKTEIKLYNSINFKRIKLSLLGLSIASIFAVLILTNYFDNNNPFSACKIEEHSKMLLKERVAVKIEYDFNSNVEKLMVEAEKLTYEGEVNYNEALNKYYSAIELDSNNQIAKDKIVQLNNLINQKVDEYLSDAEVFMNADYGENEALSLLEKALILKPNDASIIYKLQILKSKIN